MIKPNYNASDDSLNGLLPQALPGAAQSMPVPPHQREAERSVIGGLLINGKQFEAVVGLIRKEDFYDFKHQIAFGAMEGLYVKHEEIDLLTVKDFLEREEKLDDIGGIGYLAEIAHETPSASNVASYARIVRDYAIMRSLLQGCNEIRQIVFAHQNSSVDDVLSRAQHVMYNLGLQYDNNSGPVALGDLAVAAEERIRWRYDNPSKGGLSGISTGFKALDRPTSGLQRKNLIVVAGRPSMGKTALVTNIALRSAMNHGTKVLFFSLEMSSDEITERLLSLLTGIDSLRLREGTLGDGVKEWKNLSKAAGRLNETPIVIDDSQCFSPIQLAAVARRQQREGGLDLIVIDFLQLLKTDEREPNLNAEISLITRELKVLARELNVPIVVVSQLNREADKRVHHRPVMSDLRDSGSIEQNADLVLFVYRDEYYKQDSEDCGIAEVIISKHRNGPTGICRLQYTKEICRFADLAKGDAFAELDDTFNEKEE